MEIRTQDYIAGILQIVLGVIGFIANAMILRVLYKSFRASQFSAFSVLCCSRALSNCGTMLAFLLYSGPVTLLAAPIGPPIIGLKFGHLTTLTYKSAVYIQLAITFNRFIATFFPFQYPNICHRKGTFIVLGIVWFVTLIHCIPEFLPGCEYTYVYSALAWHFADTPCKDILRGPALFWPTYSVNLTSIFVNLLLCVKLSYSTYQHSRELPGEQARNRHKKNVRRFVQSFLQEFPYIVLLVVLQILNDPADRWAEFLGYTLLWECTHVWDGMVVFIYNPDMRKRLPCYSRLASIKPTMTTNVSIAPSSAHHTG